MTAKKAKQILQDGKWWKYLEFPDNTIDPDTDIDYAIEFHDALDTACYALACMEQFKNLTEE